MLDLNNMKLIPIKTAAQSVGVSEDTLMRVRNRGKIKLTRIGHKWFVKEAYLREYVEKQTDR